MWEELKENRILLAVIVIVIIAAIAGIGYYAGWF